MTESVWIDDGDEIISKDSFKYFNELIDYIDDNKLRDDFNKWKYNKRKNIK